jgi:hypothetical protein
MDSAAPASAWNDITDVFAAWASYGHLGPVVVCDHFPGVRFLITNVSSGVPFTELDVCHIQQFRGAALFTATQLGPLHRMDDRGFRRLLPGAEGTLVLLLKHCRLFGRMGMPSPDLRSMLQDEAELHLTATTLNIPPKALQRLARQVVLGDWSRYDALIIQASQLMRIPRDPRLTRDRIRLRAHGIVRCRVMQSVLREHRVVDNPTAWWSAVRSDHVVLNGDG